MNKIKSGTDLDQSRKLAEFLSPETADMVYLYWVEVTPTGTKREGIEEVPAIREDLPIEGCDVPCWSLSALLNVLPPYYQLQTQDDGIGMLCSYNKNTIIVAASNPVDACVEMILKLHEKKIL